MAIVAHCLCGGWASCFQSNVQIAWLLGICIQGLPLSASVVIPEPTCWFITAFVRSYWPSNIDSWVHHCLLVTKWHFCPVLSPLIVHRLSSYSVIRQWLPSVVWRCWLGGRKGIRPVKNMEWWGAGVVVCLEQGANDLHMVQLMPLPPHHLLLQQNPEWFILLVPTHPGCPGKRPLNVCVCVCALNSKHYNTA